MEHLKEDLRKMIEHVTTLPGTPSFEQLKGKVNVLAASLKKDALPLPRRIQEIVNRAFQNIGWSLNNNNVFQQSTFTVPNFIDCLK